MQIHPPYPRYDYFRARVLLPEQQFMARTADMAILAYSDKAFIVEVLARHSAEMRLIDTITHRDIQAIVARDLVTGKLLIVFRGTLTLLDWMRDLDVSKNSLGIHTGFYNAVLPLVKTLQAYAMNEDTVLGGHSLGASLATLMAIAANKAAKSTMLITFGSPRVGDANFVSDFMRLQIKVRRYVHGKDIVPAVPPMEMGFLHVAPALSLPQQPRPWPWRNSWPYFVWRGEFDHVPENYANALWKGE